MKAKLHVVEGGQKRSIFQDLEALRILPDDDEERVVPKRRKRAERVGPRTTFIMFPHEWFDRLHAAGAPLGTWKLALVLLDKANQEECFPVAQAILGKAAVARQHKRSLLGQLERLGLITVEWNGRKAPMVTLFNPIRRRGQDEV